MPKTSSASYSNGPTEFLTVGSETYAYRRFGSGPLPPLLYLQHFTATLDKLGPCRDGCARDARRGHPVRKRGY